MKDYFLRKCPFCGGKAVLEHAHRAFINAKTTRVAFVRCTACNARSGRYELEKFGHTSNSSEAEEMAIKSWNGRHYDYVEGI